MAPGQVIVLNGSSSSGKSSIARCLQQLSNDVYFHTGVDHLFEQIHQKFHAIAAPSTSEPAKWFRWIMQDGAVVDLELGPGALTLIAAMYNSAYATGMSGVGVIVDDWIFDARVLRLAVKHLQPLDPLFVGVHCPVEVAKGRETRRGDRHPGSFRVHSIGCHAHRVYDVEVDTSLATANECAQLILDHQQSGRSGEAFRHLAMRFEE